MTSRQLRILPQFAASAMALVFAVSARAGATRTFVSTAGNDSNTSSNCGPVTPCRTFTAALTVTNSGGEIVVLTSGGYGPATITQPVIITATDVDASISVTTLDDSGLTINTPGNVTITGLSLHGQATGAFGIDVQQVGFLRLYNVLIENFKSFGIDFQSQPVVTMGTLAIDGSTINDNGLFPPYQGFLSAGIEVQPRGNGGSVYISNTSFNNNNIGVSASGLPVTVVDSSAENNGTGFLAHSGGTLVLSNVRAVSNGIGLSAQDNGMLYFANCLIANNTAAYSIDQFSSLAGSNPGTSLIGTAQTVSGTLSTAVVLQ